MTQIRRFFRKFKRRFLRLLRRFLRSCYHFGFRNCLYVLGVFVFLIVGITLIFGREKQVPASMEVAANTPEPTLLGETLGSRSMDGVFTGEVTGEMDLYLGDFGGYPDGGEAFTEPEISPSPTPDITLEKGDDTEDVATLQARLMELGYLGIDEPTQYYGNATKYAVTLFQRQHQLQQDGIAGGETQKILYSEEAQPYVMYEGAEGDDIEDFQEQLYELGYLSRSQITGYYGTDTIEAVMKFQRRNYLTKDGKAGEQTLEMINSADARVSYTKEQEIEKERKEAERRAREQSAEGRIEKMISIAKKQVGKPYVLGAKGPDKYDCSGLVYYCLRQVDVYTRRLNASGFSKTSSWTKISSLSDVKRGDLLFFRSDSSSSVGHVGIYVGSGEMIDASSANGKVVRRSAKSSYWKRNFVCARRPIE